jgi:YD repeat-containing protein
VNRRPRNTFSNLVLCLLGCLLCAGSALAQQFVNSKIPFNQYGIQTVNPHVVDRFTWNGKLVDKVIVPSRPPGNIKAEVVSLPQPNIAAGISTLSNVPALEWAFGCSATSAGMMFGYYDRTGYPNMYTGPTNGGVFPLTNAAWPHVTINGEDRAQCPLSATRSGLDGRSIYGHVDDYWVKKGSTTADPFIGNWTEHTQGECTGDYMGTNQSSLENPDGNTTFYYYTDGARLVDFTGFEPSVRDGCHGMKLFVQSRGYQVVTNFTQLIYGYNGNTKGFTFADFKNEIDAGRPVLVQLEGHTILGFGYNDSGSIVYIHDTWDNNAHQMIWGDSYSGMPHYGVTGLQLVPLKKKGMPWLLLLLNDDS